MARAGRRRGGVGRHRPRRHSNGTSGDDGRSLGGDRGSRVAGRQILLVAASLRPYLIVFTASACVLVIEIVAGRLLAPTIGVSLYTWTSIIGVVLTGISIGSYLGGRLADRFPSQTTLGLILLAGGVSSLAVLPLIDVGSGASKALPLVARIVFLTATLFFLPSLILGMVTPVVIKLRLQDLDHTGRVVGKIYAGSTAGSILGTFITGFVLIQWIGTRWILILVALALVFMALAFGNLLRAKVPSFASLVLFLGIGAVVFSNGAFDSECLRESNYFCIRVSDTIEEGGRQVKVLFLDALPHSYVSLEDPTLLVYSYAKVTTDIATHLARRSSLRVLFVGGGGYTLPRYLEVTYPDSVIEVIEIDPEVTGVAFEYLGLQPDTRIVTYNEDARMAVPRLPNGEYDLVVGDAFNDITVPYHLTTREFNEQIMALLNEQGIYAISVADRLHSGRFLRAYVSTLQRTFPYVYIMRDDPRWDDDSRYTYLVVGSLLPLSANTFEEANFQAGRGQPITQFMPEDTFESWLNSRKNVLLTDDYAPVDNLMASIHLTKRGLSVADAHYNAGAGFQSQGRFEDAIAEYDEAIKLHPEFARAYNNRGTAYERLAQYQRAIQDYDQAIRLDPAHALAYNNRGSAYGNMGQIQRAIQDYSEAIRLNPQSAQAYANRALAYTLLNMDDEAQEDLDQAVRLGFDRLVLLDRIDALERQR